MSSQAHGGTAPPSPTQLQRLLVWAFLGLVAVPVLHAGAMGRPMFRGLPQTMADAQNISCLFSRKPDGWQFFYFQVRRPGGGWQTLDPDRLAPLRPFAYRTRLHRYLVAWGRQEGRGTEEMAAWILRRDREIHPQLPAPAQVRIAFGWTTNRVEDPPQGRWSPPPWERQPRQRRRVLATYDAEALSP